MLTVPASVFYELPSEAPVAEQPVPTNVAGLLAAELLSQNVVWFSRLRWQVAFVLALFGLLSMTAPELFQRAGLQSNLSWPVILAAVLAAANALYLGIGERLRAANAATGQFVLLWGQIIVDLLILTVVVHYLGSKETPAHMAYLFHIVLACIFFTRTQSLAVVILAAGLFTTLLGLEYWHVLPARGVFIAPGLARHATPARLAIDLIALPAAWLIVWYLASQLSNLVRRRDEYLASANHNLLQAREERRKHMLQTAHELKSPFAAIHANSQLLVRGHCGPLSDKALEVAVRIARRAQRLILEIQDMLHLADLEYQPKAAPDFARLDLAQLLAECLDLISDTARQHNVGLVQTLQHGTSAVTGSADQLKIMLLNLLHNAVTYSHDGGQVRIRTIGSNSEPPGVVLTISDDGLGIAPEKIPKIFDEYYRTNEAVRHHRESTGLGLAIVKRVALQHQIRVRVRSCPGQGSTFELHFPLASQTTININ